MQQGRIAACHALKHTLPEAHGFPGIYSVPEISTCGMSERELQEREIAYALVSRFRETLWSHAGVEHVC